MTPPITTLMMREPSLENPHYLSHRWKKISLFHNSKNVHGGDVWKNPVQTN